MNKLNKRSWFKIFIGALALFIDALALFMLAYGFTMLYFPW